MASDEHILENNYMLVMLWNLSVIITTWFSLIPFFISGANSKNNLTHYQMAKF